MEATGLDEDMSNKISIPILIGDPSIPTALVKNPTRTVVIKKLTHDISSRHIEAALTFCGSNITGFFLGSSSSAAYVEFEVIYFGQLVSSFGSCFVHLILLISLVHFPAKCFIFAQRYCC